MDFQFQNPDKEYMLTLSDGTQVLGLTLNGNNFVSKEPIDKSFFDGKLSKMTVTSKDGSQEFEDMRCEQVMEFEGQWLILILPIPESEKKEMKLMSDIEYISMMADIDLA